MEGGEELVLRQESNYPWDGTIKFTVDINKPTIYTLYLRIPNWCRCYTIKVNGEIEKNQFNYGYALIERQWLQGDIVELSLSMPIERMTAHPAVHQDIGKIALQRGPLVYCLEEVDHYAPVDRIILPTDAVLTSSFKADILEGVVVIEGEALIPSIADWEEVLYKAKAATQFINNVHLQAVPFYAWDNRKPGAMVVWIPEKERINKKLEIR